jgi:cell wall-associated NlpC family hydrolase
LLLVIALAAALPAAAAPAPAGTALYRVRQGETLYRIARRFNTTPERLAALNDIRVGAILRIGQELRVPAAPTAVAPEQDPLVLQAILGPEAPAAISRTGGPQRARIAPLPSRGAQWMATIVALSRRQLGAPYRWAGNAPDGFDCSGFITYVFDRTGIDLPRTTFAMFGAGTPVPAEQLQPGDIVFFQTVSPGPSHAGVYLGDGRFIHASSGQGRVTMTALTDPYYAARYLGARRF